MIDSDSGVALVGIGDEGRPALLTVVKIKTKAAKVCVKSFPMPRKLLITKALKYERFALQ